VRVGIVFALLSMLCFAGNIFITRAAMSRMGADTGFPVVLAVNIAFAALVFGIERLFSAAPFSFQWKAAGWFALSGIVGIYMGRRMLFEAVHILGPARASVLHTASPVVTLIAAWFLVGESLGVYEILLMGLVMAGLLAAQLQHTSGAAARIDGRAALRHAMLLSLLTVVGFGVGNAIRGMAIREWNEAALGAVLGSSAALLCQLVTGSALRAILEGLRKGEKMAIGLYVASGIATVSGTMFGAMAMHRVEIAIATVVTYTTPLVVFPVSILLLRNREQLSLRTALGALMVVAGIALLAFR
jgi:drug/metabolite transporter (DMT)-like permease